MTPYPLPPPSRPRRLRRSRGWLVVGLAVALVAAPMLLQVLS